MTKEESRTYSEEEVGKIISRAIARQEVDRHRLLQREGGLSLDEIQQLAREAGIDARYIFLAASDIERGDGTDGKSSFLGAPMRVVRERLVPGTLSDEQIAAMVVKIRNTLSSPQVARGNVEMIGRSFECGTPPVGSVRNIVIRAVPEGDHTRLFYQENFGGTNTLFHIWWMITLFMATLFTFIPEIPAVAAIVMFASTALLFTGGWFGSRAYSKSKMKEIETLMDRLEEIGQPEPAETLSGPEVATTPKSTIALDQPEDMDSENAEPRPSRRRSTRRS
jgi:hypothetical protein